VYVFTPKGEVIELSGGATPLDFAYFVHSDIGNHCIGARVNGRMVPFRYNLQTGDVVEILTSKNQQPHIDWLDIVVTGRARTKIRQRLRDQGDLEPIEHEHEHEKIEPLRPPPPKSPVRHVDDATREKLVRIEGKKGTAVQFAKCCNPMPGHAILGYATRSTGITVHRMDCRNFSKTKRDPKRTIEAAWEGEGLFQTGMRVVIGQRPNVLADITNAIRPMNIDIIKANYRPGKNGRSQFEFVFDISDKESIDRVAGTIRTVAGVIEVATMPLGETS
jgi:GTP pyrophosphokinase